jgi:hypothetical protein
VLALALALTLLNATKPLHIDDGCYWQYARHFAREPLDPYGFYAFTNERPEPANETISPPGLSYWWAIGMRLFGERPVLWKLWLFPLCLLFVGSLHFVLRRFARGLELPLTAMLVSAPVVLPALNLMLDIPALALSLFAFTLFLRASDRFDAARGRGYALAAAAGLALGLASQTKYTALLMPAVLFVHALLFRRLRLWALTSGIAVAMFAGWETFMHLRYGRSHFLLHLEANHTDLSGKLGFAPPLLSIAGFMGPGLLLLGLAAFQRSARLLAATAALIAAGFVVVAATPEDRIAIAPLKAWSDSATLPYVIFAGYGIATLATLAFAAARLLRALPMRRPFARARRLDWFLAAWLGLELAGYFVMTPFPAARRLLGLIVVGTIVTGRLASRTLRSRDGRRRVLASLAVNAAVGALFFGVDLKEALATRQAVEDSAQWIWLRSAPGSRIFYLGHWGFQYYAEAAGMIAAVDRQFYRRTILRAGDWLIVPSTRIFQQRFWIDPERTEKAHVLLLRDGLPLRTFFCYYMGWTPLERHDGPRLVVTIYRVKEDFPVRPYRGSRAPS